MNILVVNSGSSSIKFSVFLTEPDAEAQEPRVVLDGEISGIGGSAPSLSLHPEPAGGSGSGQVNAPTADDAMHVVFDTVCRQAACPPDAVGYRVVHPGATLHGHQRITPEVLRSLEEASAFAPLHDPAVVGVIRQGMERFPHIGHYACFDTVFHDTMPEEASIYPLPQAIRDRGVRRYGFHGLSCESAVRSLRAAGGELPARMVIAHLGSGCSVTALRDGLSVDTSMGLTPTGGVVMGTRPGDLDPGVVVYLLRQSREKDAAADVESMLNHDAGLAALTGQPNDMKAVRKAAAQADRQALLGLKVFTRSITKAIGAYCWLLGGLDALVFTGGIGEHDAATRSEVLAGLDGLGIVLDPAQNGATGDGVRSISTTDSRTKVFVVPAQEDRMIALHVDRLDHSR